MITRKGSLFAIILTALAISVTPAGFSLQKRSPKRRAAPVVEIKVVNFEFLPKEVRVKTGTTITWKNREGVHQISSDDGKSFSSPTLNPGDTFSHRFTKPGRYAYYCAFHGGRGGSGMSGVIVVEKK